jgi:cell division protein FtsZ
MSSNNEFESIAFDLPKNQSNVIKVIGVGGGGSNAINHMFRQGIKGVDFVICNTDAQAIQNSGVPNKIQLGVNLTEGLGAGANPEIGEQAAVESFEAIQQMLDTNTKMVFITAGMGGGTGTGAAPIIAKMAKDADILTVGIVTMPFQFEGKMRNEQAQKGVEKLRDVVDSLVVINNNKLREVYGNLGFKAGFSKADEVLSTAARGIAEVITHHYTQNIDLRDAKTVLSNSGTAIMGSATASGQNRAHEAILKALDSPLLNDNKITGAKNVLLLIVSGSHEITIDEIGEINDHIQTEAGYGANIIMGVGEDETLEEAISVTIIATGFNIDQQDEITNTEAKKVVHALEEDHSIEQELFTNNNEILTELETETPEKSIVETTNNQQDKIVKHTLEVFEIEEVADCIVKDQSTIDDKEEIVSTSEYIKNLDVEFEEISSNLFTQDNIDDDFIITDVTPKKEENSEITTSEEQVTLSFDLPINEANQTTELSKDETINLNLESDVKNIEVHDYIELVAPTQVDTVNEPLEKADEIIHFDLEETEEAIQTVNLSENLEVDQDIVFEKKVVEKPTETTIETQDEADPLNSPISEILKQRAEVRRQKMKEFNYKFNTAKIDDMEKVPAYKRQGVNLNDTQHSSESNTSRTSISVDENDDIQLRENNSYLHDNVD